MKNSLQIIGIAAVLSLTSISMAKVSDFHSLIVENSQAQSDLHKNIQQEIDTARAQLKNDEPEKFIVEKDSNSINVPTSRSLLSFKKEKKYYRPSEKVSEKRLAEELSQAE